MMNKHFNFKSMYRTALVALCLMTVGVGNVWANTDHPIYCAIDPTTLGTGYLDINVHKGGTNDGGVWYRTRMTKIATTISKASTGETKDLYYAQINYVETGLQELQFEIWDGDESDDKNKRAFKTAFNSWWTSDGYTKPIFDYDNGNFTTYPADLDQKTSYIYFNAADWTDDYIQVAVGHGLYQGYNQLTQLTNTTIYYANPSLAWEDAVHVAFLGHKNMFETKANWLTDMPQWGDHYTGYLHYQLSENKYHYFARSAGDANGAAISFRYNDDATALIAYLNKTQTVQARVKATGSSYSDAAFASWPGSVSVVRTYMSSASATSTPEAANMTSATTDAVITSSITLTASANSGYYFEGWGDASNSNPTDGTAAKTYTITDAKTSYAFFSQAYTLTYERKGDYSTSSVTCYSVADFSGSTTSGSSIPTGHMITIVATPATGYEVKGWYSDASCTSAYTSGSGGVTIEDSNNTFKLASLNANSAVYPKFGPKTYTINLESMDADDDGTTSVDVTYNASTNMTASDAINTPTKAHYTFDGYWTSDNTGTTLDHQLIDADGKWIADVTGYTNHSGDDPTWVHDYAISLYAKWDEVPYTITMAVSPSGAGTTSPASTATGKLVTESGNIIATPAAGYKFKEWQFSKTDENYDVWCADGYSSTDATIHIKAQHNGTLTAVFEERYSLVGSLQDDSGEGGMPGWEDYTKTFTVNSSSPVDLTRTCTLQANKTYKLQVHDLATSTNLGRSGCVPVCVLEENASLVMENSNNDVFLYTGGAGEYIFKITAVDGSGHPTLTVLRPYPVNFGQKYLDIDGTLHTGTTGGTAAATAGSALSSGDYVTYNTSVTHTATPESGYTFAGWWSSDAFEGDRFSNVNPMTYAVTSGDNAYAKFVETSTSVTLANDGNGKVQISGEDATSTTCGVTTTRSLTAVPDAGYKFKNWTTSSSPDFEVDDDDAAEVTLTGLGDGTAGTLTANFEERYSIKGTMNGENWGTDHKISNIGTNGSSKDTGYVEIDLPANTTYEFAIYDEQTGGWYKAGTNAVYNMTYTNHTNWEFGDTKTYNCGITTAGKGTYKFIFNITDTTVTVVYPTSYQVNYGASPSVGGNITVVDGDENAVPNGGYVVAGGSVTYTAAANDGYTFVGWCGNDSYGDTFNNDLSWTDGTLAATSNSYAKFKSTNFVIYRTGDMEDDPRAAYDDVESFDGGTISEKIEFRMQVSHLDQWYSLSLPFTVDSVCVWDNEDAKYYKLVPYYRTGGTFYTGHYVIRTPELTNDSLALANFSVWNDPSSPEGYRPSKKTPYIVQWHHGYFLDRYVSFFGAASQNIPESMTEGERPKTKSWVTVYGNDAMVEGSVEDAYTLNGDEIWERPVDKGKSVTIQPFECYIRANAETTNKYLILRRGMTFEDEATHFETIDVASPVNAKVLIDGQIYILREGKMYTLQGILVQ